MADFKSAQRVRIWDGTYDYGFDHGHSIFVRNTDGTNDLNLVVINSGYGSTPTVIPIAGKYEASPTTYGDGDAVPFLTDANGRLVVSLSGGGAIYVDDSAFSVENDKVTGIGAYYDDTSPDTVVEGHIGIPRMTSDRKLLMRIAGSNDGYRWDIDSNGNGKIDIAAQSLTAVKISANTTANAETNPIFVQIVKGVVSGTEIHSYADTSTTKDLTTDHDKVVTSGKTFLLRSVIGSASGAGKFTIAVGAPGGPTVKAVLFTSGAMPYFQVNFDPPIEQTGTGTEVVRVIRRNDDNQDMSMYTTIIGNEI